MAPGVAFRRHAERGSLLLGVLVGVLITGILMSMVATIAESSLQTAKKIAAMGTMEDLRNLIRLRLNCEQTLANVQASRGNIVMRDRTGNPIAPTNENGVATVGKWRIVARQWNASTGELSIAVEGPDQPSTPLFRTVPLICRR
jgi:type II secretory pathway pseudopilin PulG